MKEPKFTDMYRYPYPYRPANTTDVSETFKRARALEAKRREELQAKIKQLPQRRSQR